MTLGSEVTGGQQQVRFGHLWLNTRRISGTTYVLFPSGNRQRLHPDIDYDTRPAKDPQ